MSRGVPPSHVDRYNQVVELLLRQAQDDASMTVAMSRAREIESAEAATAMLELDDAMLQMLGWTRTELIVARDARLSRNQVPFYLHAAQERHVTRMRVAQDAGNGNQEAACYMIPVADTRPMLPAVEGEEETDK